MNFWGRWIWVIAGAIMTLIGAALIASLRPIRMLLGVALMYLGVPIAAAAYGEGVPAWDWPWRSL